METQQTIMENGEMQITDAEQEMLFNIEPDWRSLWTDMPEYEHSDLTSWQSIKVHFKNREDREAFSKLAGQTVTDFTRAIWYPKAEIGRTADKRWESDAEVHVKYPVYIISKGRWETRLTSKALDKIGVPYRIVVEPQEASKYAEVIDPKKILVLPFSNLGQGSIPARNWVWEHSKAAGDKRHWILDDNIRSFYRFNENLKVLVSTGSMFRAAEDFVDRYENVALSGFQYFMFAPRKEQALPAFYLNTRIYSCILIQNEIPYKWRGRYNEDTDLSIRVLKDGWCTVLFNAFLAEKTTTMTMAGGNTDELYKDDGRLKMAESLKEQHPDCVLITEKWGRPQHHVDYRRWKSNKLVRKMEAELKLGINNFGMKLRKVDPEQPKKAAPQCKADIVALSPTPTIKAEPKKEKKLTGVFDNRFASNDRWKT